MAGLSVSFGNGGSALQQALVDTDPNFVGVTKALDAGGVAATALSGGSVGNGINSVAAAGGLVLVDFDEDSNAFNFDVAGKWNSVKNALAVSDHAADLTFKDFVHVDVYLGNGGDSSVEIDNAKRGNVVTGTGNDTIDVSLLTNNNDWSNHFEISTGKGSDTITFSKGEIALAQAALNSVVDGHFTTVTIDAGAGNDTIDLSGVRLKSADVTGGAGNDTILASAGADTFHYGLQAKGTSGFDVISGFNGNADHIDLGAGLAVAGHATMGTSTLVQLTDHTTILLDGVTDFSSDWFV